MRIIKETESCICSVHMHVQSNWNEFYFYNQDVTRVYVINGSWMPKKFVQKYMKAQ